MPTLYKKAGSAAAMVNYSSISCIFFVALFSIFTIVSISSAASSHGEVEDEREFNYKKNDEKGPERWGELKPEWEMCGKGEMQSPIDLMNERVNIVSHLGRLNRDYNPSNATLKNRGHDIMLKFEDGAGTIKINGFEYELQQLHWHSPSEHTINGRRFALELHMVHEGRNRRMAVVTVLYKIGRADTFIRSLEKELEGIAEMEEAEKNVGMIDPTKIKIGSRKYYRYTGSLTTPPCTQNVTWSVVRKVRTVTRKQVKLLRVAVHDDANSNARPVQPTNKRIVHLYRPIVGRADPAFLYKVGIIRKHCLSICCNEQVTISQNKIIICHPADIPYSESYYMVIAVSWQLWPVSQNL